MAKVSFLSRGCFLPKIDSLQPARLVIIDREGGRVASNTLITHGDCSATAEKHQDGNANWRLAPFLCGQKSRGSLVFLLGPVF